MDYSNYLGYDLNAVAFPVNEYGFKVTRKFWSGEKRNIAFQLSAGMVDDMKKGEKDQLPIVDFRTNKKFACVVADFDELPPNYSSFSEFRDVLYKAYPTACVTPSASGKVKVIFLVENMLHLDPVATIKSLIEPSLHEYLDLSPSALGTTYFNEEMYQNIRNWLPTALYHPPVGLSFEEITCELLADEYQTTIAKLSSLLVAEGLTLKSFRSLNETRRDKLSVSLITMALDLCTEEGTLLNQEILAIKLGLKSPRTAARILDALMDAGLLKMVSNYSAGNKSRTYTAAGKLLDFFIEHGLHTTKATEIRENTIVRHNINTLIARLLPPQQDANRYYMKISKLLVKAGLPLDSITKILYDIDIRRPKVKQRPKGYFKYLSTWASKR